MINPIAQKQIDYIAERCKEIKPLVVIRCITYNHEAYLKDALEGFLMQKTDFPFVAIVHDDASTDKTAEVLKEYAKKYPEIIFPFYEKENQYSKKDGSIKEIMNKACDVTGAKYVALCEGDDYWIDSSKLQKQVDFLETHKDYSMCFHKADVITDNPEITTDIYNHLIEKEYTADEIIAKWTVPTASVMLRKEIMNKVPSHKDFCVGDNVIFLTCAQYGKLYCLSDEMSVYRRQKNGWFLQHNKYEIKEKMLSHYNAILTSFTDLSIPSLKENLAKNYASLTYHYLLNKNINFSFIKKAYLKSGMKYIKYLILLLLRKILYK